MKRRLLVVLAALLVGAALGSLSCAPAPPRSVILIVIDTLRADHLGLYGYQRPTSPELDAIAQQGAVFENAFATSPWTLPSFGSLFTGRLPAEHRAGWRSGGADEGRSFLPMRDGVATLAETLAATGRDTGAIMNNAFLHPDFGVARGFQTYDHIGGNRRKIRRADEVVDSTLEWLRKEDRGDFFLVVHFFDPHLNYDAPEPFRGRWGADIDAEERNELMDLRPLRQRIRQGEEIDWDFLVGAYDEEIAFVDQEIGRLWRALQDSGTLAESLVVLTADHGEEFNDHDGFEHGHTLFDELVRVPLVVWGPGVEPGRRTAPVSLIDIYPTVLGALALPAQDGLPGRSLVPHLKGDSPPLSRTLIAERTLYGQHRESALAWPYKVIFEPQRGEVMLFDLESDAAERQDIAHLRSDIADDLLAQLEAYRQHAESIALEEAVEPDEKTLENLRSLGYIQ